MAVRGELVDQGDIDVAESVFQQLGKLSLPRCRHGNGPLDEPTIEILERVQ